MHVRHPIWLRLAERPGAAVFASMFTIESAARAILSTVITVQALTLLHDARSVSILFSLVGITGLSASFAIPLLVRHSSRRTVYSLGGMLLVGAGIALALVTVPGQIVGMLMRVFGAACLNVTTSLYIMQYIAKRDLTRSEPMRLQFSAAAWTLGPWAGVTLYTTLGPLWAYGCSIAAALTLLAVFWLLRLTENPALPKANRPPPTPLRSIGRYLAQPRLRLAWLITFGRSTWWVFFFIYTPIYLIKAGHSPQFGAAAVSAGNALLFLTPVFGRLGAKLGIGRVLSAAFLFTGSATVAAGLLFDIPIAAIACLLLGALGCTAMDALGNIPYMRAVHPYERPEMTTVFRTYLDFSELLTPAFFAALLTIADLQTAFVAFGLVNASFAIWPRFLPKRM